MSSAWLTPEERDPGMYSDTTAPLVRVRRLLAHAELADQIIHELATALRLAYSAYLRDGGYKDSDVTGAVAVLARVDALGLVTTTSRQEGV